MGVVIVMMIKNNIYDDDDKFIFVLIFVKDGNFIYYNRMVE